LQEAHRALPAWAQSRISIEGCPESHVAHLRLRRGQNAEEEVDDVFVNGKRRCCSSSEPVELLQRAQELCEKTRGIQVSLQASNVWAETSLVLKKHGGVSGQSNAGVGKVSTPALQTVKQSDVSECQHFDGPSLRLCASALHSVDEVRAVAEAALDCLVAVLARGE